MKMIEELRDRAKKKFSETNDDKYRVILNILDEDECFFIIDMDVALDILASLDVKNPLLEYRKLTSYEEMEKDKIRVID